jgi:hypothetical protein
VSYDCNLNDLFAYQSEDIVIGNKTNTIYPFNVANEIVGTTLNSKLYRMLNRKDSAKTQLLDTEQMIVSFPKISLHTLNADQIVNKIKTYILFS